MGCQLFYRNNNLPSIGSQAIIRENISEGLEEMKNIPDDQILCPKCKRIPEILNVHTDNGFIELKCNYHGEFELSIEEYAKALNKSSYFKIRCYNCNELQKNKENMYQYCPYCKVDLCQKCINTHPEIGLGQGKKIKHHVEDHVKFCIPVNSKNHKCLEHSESKYTDFCLDCQENICPKEEKRHQDHETVSLFTLGHEVEINKNIIIEKNKVLYSIIKFNELILNSYENCKDDYFHIKSLINVGKSLRLENERNSKELENMFYHLEKSQKAREEALTALNNQYELDFEGNELKLTLRMRNLGNRGFELLSKIQFLNLKDMDISKNNISNIESLNEMDLPFLEYIDASENIIADIKPIAELKSKKLKEICLQNNQIEDFSPLIKSDFKGLERLRIEGNHFNKDLQDSKKLLEKYSQQIIYEAVSLEDLNKKYDRKIQKDMKLVDLSDLEAGDIILRELYIIVKPELKIRELSLRNNGISNASLIGRISLKYLRILDLSVNMINNVKFITEMKGLYLEEIFLNDNRVKDISPLEKILDLDITDKKDDNGKENIAVGEENKKKKIPFSDLKVISLKRNFIKKNEEKTQIVLQKLEKKKIAIDIQSEEN